MLFLLSRPHNDFLLYRNSHRLLDMIWWEHTDFRLNSFNWFYYEKWILENNFCRRQYASYSDIISAGRAWKCIFRKMSQNLWQLHLVLCLDYNFEKKARKEELKFCEVWRSFIRYLQSLDWLLYGKRNSLCSTNPNKTCREHGYRRQEYSRL